jgi:cation diffusion facilitator family transporter
MLQGSRHSRTTPAEKARMHSHSVESWTHDHVFLGGRHDRHERRTWLVVGLTAAAMVAEIAAGSLFGSMALTADGWHMSTHAAALAIAALAYRVARTHRHDPRFAFGTGKLGELAGFASAVILGIVALLIAYECVTRLLTPVPIRFAEATVVAVVGLAVNLASAWLLFDQDHHSHDGGHHGEHGHALHHPHGGDSNIRAAFMHVLADALTSVLAIVALLAGAWRGWTWLDPAMGLVGAVIIAVWSAGLIRSAGAVLLDMVPSQELAGIIRERLETDGDRVVDLHLWRLGPGHVGLIVSVVSDRPAAPAVYKDRLAGTAGLSHVTIEVQACPHPVANAA